MNNMTYLCPVCGAEIGWDAQANCFKCMYCDGEFTVDQLSGKNIDAAENATPDNVQHAVAISEEEMSYTTTDDGTEGSDLVKYQCSHCFAEMITERATAATTCVYCGHPIVFTEQVVGDFAPKYVLPFEKTKEEAHKAFTDFMNKPLTPKDFKEECTIDKVQGIYIPFWLFSGRCDAVGRFETRTCIKERRHDKKIHRTWDVYESLRKGANYFEHVPADGSSKTDDAAMQSIEPFDFSKLIEFNSAYLSGYLAERYDEDAEVQKPKIEERIKNTTHDKMVETCNFDRVRTEEFKHQIVYSGADYALLPTWLFYCTYKNKRYFFAMNGQTGKFIGNLPISLGKAAAIWGILFLISALLCWGLPLLSIYLRLRF
jgi:DNA-directed RNA polymerase subunit RPC12/RpoP